MNLVLYLAERHSGCSSQASPLPASISRCGTPLNSRYRGSTRTHHQLLDTVRQVFEHLDENLSCKLVSGGRPQRDSVGLETSGNVVGSTIDDPTTFGVTELYHSHLAVPSLTRIPPH